MSPTPANASVADLVLAVHPTAKGFGWAVFESPLVPIDWGTAGTNFHRIAKLLTSLEEIMDRYEPAVLALEEFDSDDSRRAPRIRKVANSIVSLGHMRGMHVARYDRDAVRTCFSRFGAQSRYEIAEVIARHIAALAPKLPSKRRAWESEKARQCIFDAAAVALTYFASLGDCIEPSEPAAS